MWSFIMLCTKLNVNWFLFAKGVVMIRCDIHKGKLRFGNFIEAGRDAQPRKDDKGLVVDHGNVGKRHFIISFYKWNDKNNILHFPSIWTMNWNDIPYLK